MTTGKLIASIRESKGVLQKELARAINIDPVVLNRIEKGKRPARGDEIKAIADYFNVSTDYLLGRSNLNYNNPLSNDQLNFLHYYNLIGNDGRNILLGVLKSLANTYPASASMA